MNVETYLVVLVIDSVLLDLLGSRGSKLVTSPLSISIEQCDSASSFSSFADTERRSHFVIK